MNPISYASAVTALKSAASVLITTHTAPDGDAIGSALGVYHLARALGVSDVTVACHDAVPKMYTFLAGADRVIKPASISRSYALAVVTDVAQYERCGDTAPHAKKCGDVLVLDHHIEHHPCGTLHVIDPTYASASEIVFVLFQTAGLPVAREAAECIYVGLATDTGGFRFGNTTAATHRRAATLIESGVDVSEISSRVFESHTRAKLALLERALHRMVVTAEGRVAYSFLTNEDMTETAGAQEDIEGIVNYARNIEGIKVGILFREADGAKKVKVSMRSVDGFDSAACLKPFGGGGHKGAAGLTLETTLDDAKSRVLRAVFERLAEGSA